MKPKLNARFILKTVSYFYKLDIQSLSGECKKAFVVKARQVYFYLCHLYSDSNYREMGELINRHPATGMHAVNKIKIQRWYYLDLGSEIHEIIKLMDKSQELKYSVAIPENVDLLFLSKNYAGL